MNIDLVQLAGYAAQNHLLPYALLMQPNYETPPHLRLLARKLEAVERGEITRLVVTMPPRHGKQLADSTPVPTPTGWTTHGELRVGGYVFGPDGVPTKILAVSGKTPSDVRVTFSDGSHVDCHENHEWTVYSRAKSDFMTVPTSYFMETNRFGKPRALLFGKSKPRCGYQLPVAAALERPATALPMPAYTLGAWLGDGSLGKPCVTHTAFKDAMVAGVVADGFSVATVCVHTTTGVSTTYFQGKGGLTDALRAAGVYEDKHVPAAYLTGSVSQRLELLAGLIDSDGSVCPDTNRVVFTTTNTAIRDGVVDLATTLGFRPYTMAYDPVTSSSGIVGKKVCYVVGFQPTRPIPTRLPTKQIARFAKQRRVGIVSVERIVPTEVGHCIQVDRADGLYVVGKTLIVTHNSNMISELFPAWYLGKRPNEQVMFAAYGQDLADGFGRKVRNHIASPQHQTLFPASRLADDSKSANKFSMSAGGVYNALGVGGPGTGKGADLLVIDDPLKNREEADSKTIRDKLWDWYASVAYTRLMPGARIVVVLTRWHEDDLIGRLAKGHEQFELLNLPAVAEENDALGRKPGEALWPERYNETDLQRIRYTIGEREFAALYQQRPAPLEGALFRRSWIQRATAPRAGARIAMGVDLALSTKQGADYTAIVVVARDEVGKIYVLDVVRQRADFPTALAMIRDMAAKWKPIQIGIESVAYQAVVVQELLRTTTLPIRGITPDKDKMTRATPVALRYEQGMIYHADLPGWFEDELLAFPRGEHDDSVDAFVYAYLTVMKLGFSDDARVRPPDVHQYEPMDEEIGL